jgi:hypothetical protein
MAAPRLLRILAILAVITVALLLLFPAANGPYSATHGPATALRAIQEAMLLLAIIALGSILEGTVLPTLHSESSGDILYRQSGATRPAPIFRVCRC